MSLVNQISNKHRKTLSMLFNHHANPDLKKVIKAVKAFGTIVEQRKGSGLCLKFEQENGEKSSCAFHMPHGRDTQPLPYVQKMLVDFLRGVGINRKTLGLRR